MIPKVLERIKLDLESGDLKTITTTELEIWSTPEGTTYIDGAWFPLRAMGTPFKYLISPCKQETRGVE